MISIFTFTLGRELYLKCLIESIKSLGGDGEFEHHICFQGTVPSDDLSIYLGNLCESSYPLKLHFWHKNFGGCEGSSKIIPCLSGNLILKLDDDAILRSDNFFKHIEVIHDLIPDSIFSPFPVGLINNIGGIVSGNLNLNKRFVRHSEVTDCYYTFRKTNMVGGLARISPVDIIKKVKWPEDIRILEDTVFSKLCGINNIPMYYLENALIVEHQESILGQKQRYGGKKMLSDIRESKIPKISVIVTTHNREDLVLNALGSMLSQSFKDYEVIIVDDCSTDNTEEKIKKYIKGDDRFKYLKLEKNHEYHSYPKNFGINLAKSPYIAFLDDDDEYNSFALSSLYDKAISSKADVVYGGYTVIDEEVKGANGVYYRFDHDLLLRKNFIVTSSVLVKKDSLKAVGGFDENVSRFSDWHLWLKMDQAGYKFDSFPDQLSIVNISRSDSMSKKYDVYTDAEGSIVSHPYFDITDFQAPQLTPKNISEESVKASTACSDLVSIVVPVFNRPDLTKVCIDSILEYTSFPFELILVQEGNDSEITKLLESYKVKFIHNKVPLGFAGAMNSGYKLAKGNYICFLNNDVVVIPNWLTYMIEAFKKDPIVGLVTPTYTETKSKQNIDFNNKEEFTYVKDPMNLKGVCFLISRETLNEVGIWDESFGRGGGEDNDICIRINKAGYKLVIARKSFIYHYGSAAFRELFNNDIPYSKKYAANQFQKVKKKWKFDKEPRVRIAIPCQNGWLWHELTLRLIQWSHSQTFKMGYKCYPFLSPLDNARNLAVKDFLEDFWDYLVFIDQDIIPPLETIDELLKADKDVIAPLCLTIKPDDNNMIFPIPVAHRYDEDHKYRPYYGQGVEETDTITGGMFMVKREVYDNLERPFYFTYHKDGTVEYSEDFVFSQQVQSLGYKLYTHYGITCEHMKTMGIKSFNDALVFTSRQVSEGNKK